MQAFTFKPLHENINEVKYSLVIIFFSSGGTAYIVVIQFLLRCSKSS